MGTHYTPDLSVEAARYSPHDYLVRFTALTGWTLAVARRFEDHRFVATTPEEQETCLLISKEEALELIDTWEFSLKADAEWEEECARLAIERADPDDDPTTAK